MKILKQEDPKAWSHQFTCKKCKAVCEASCDDVNRHYSEADGPHPSCEYFDVSCPVCDENIPILAKDMPEVVLIQARRRYRSNYDPY